MKKSRFTADQVFRILGEVDSGRTVREVRNAHGLIVQTFYTWRKKYARLVADDADKLRELECENSEIKRFAGKRRYEKAHPKPWLALRATP
jgi:putative transposase